MQVWNSGRNEIVKRLLADTREMCGGPSERAWSQAPR
jgi:hypothetical protein